MPHKVTASVSGKEIHIETGKVAKQADGAVTVQLGETIIIVAAVAATKAKPGQEFFPLTVDYREKAAAAGKFPGGYFKREGRPTEKEILTMRLIDRPIRPLFPKGWYNEVQVQSIVLSADGSNDPDILSIIGASAALMVSDILMFEGSGKEISEADFNAALQFGQDCCTPLIEAQQQLAQRAPKKKREITLNVVPEDILAEAKRLSGDRMV